jgi:hemerythrin-like domain-containing protein
VHKAIEVLMGEHRLIEQALGSLEAFAAEIRAGGPAPRRIVGEYAEFFRGFADVCHHGKEEQILFRRLLEEGFSREAGPLAVMYYEHELGRAHVRGLAAAGSGAGALVDPELAGLLAHADDFVPLLRQHILKEDRILYPMALQALGAADLDRLSTEFEAFEARVGADGSRDRLLGLADRLTTRIPPDPARMAVAAAMSPCGR